MALPIYATWLANIRGLEGKEGKQGRPGTFEHVDLEILSPFAYAYAETDGEFGEILKLGLPRGIPGVNGVPADAAVGTYVATPGTASRSAVVGAVAEGVVGAFADPESPAAQAAAALFPTYRVWDPVAGAYPPRIPGAKNIFFGPVDPGLLADPVVDVWEPGDATSLASVVAAMLDTSSPLFAATQAATVGGRVPLQLFAAAGTTITREVIGASPNRLMGWRFPAGANNVLFATAPVPVGWTNVRTRVRWMHTAAGGSGAVRLGCEIVPYTPGTGAAGIQLQNTNTIPEANTVTDRVFTGSNPVTPGGGVTVGVARFGGSGSDTFAEDIYILDVTLERQ